MATRRQRRLVRGAILALVGLGAAAGLYFVAAVSPADSPLYPKCQLRQLTGLHCPGCGLTRALHSGLNGDLIQMVAFNPLAVVVFPVLAVVLARLLWAWAWDRTSETPVLPRWTWLPWAVGAVLVVFSVLRNVPVYPFTLLAPHVLTR
jgi:hypothetical protein